MSTAQPTNQSTILVTGATGKTGSRVLQRLQDKSWPVRSGSRSSKPSFDWYDEATWIPALQNIHTVYIVFFPDLAVPGAADIIRSFTQQAVQQGVQKLVLLSGRGEPEAQEAEQVVMNAGLPWTIVRASWFSQNFSEGYLLEPIRSGHVAFPAGDVGEPFIDVDDIADVVVAALTDDKHNGQLYEVTGPRLLTFKEAVAEIANITGRKIRYQQVPMETYSSMLTEYKVPREFIQLLNYLLTEVLDGRNEHLSDGVQKALGRKPTDFSDFVKKAAATGVWNA